MPAITGIAARLSNAVALQYRVERELGSGGMASVFLAHDLKHDRDVAIKVLHPELTAALGTERFLAEIKTTARLQHPHILPLLDSGEAGGLLYYVMPLVSGESLRARLMRERQLPIDDALRIAREVATALDYAHRQGVVHRDIKPENILLQDGQALVADFGIALAVSAAGGERLTVTGISLGTPQYMSPEQAMGDRRIDSRCDVYALGVVTFEMLAGEPPFTAPSPQGVLAKVITDKPPSLVAHRELVPTQVALAVDKALAKLPADRYSSVAEFSAALSESRAPVTGSVQTSRDFAVADWRVMAALIFVAAGVAIAIVWAATRGRGAGPFVYDVALPDSAPIAFRYSRNLSVSPRGDFVVYVAASNDSATTRLWYRSLHDATARPLPGTEGAFDPSVSPDGESVVFFAPPHVKIAAVSGGAPRILGTIRIGVRTLWLSRQRFLVVDEDGRRLRWFDPQTGETPSGAGELRDGSGDYCFAPDWIGRNGALICGGGPVKFATVQQLPKRTANLVRTTTGHDRLAGSHFRVLDDYLVFMSNEGELRAAAFDRARLSAGRTVTLITGIRREAYRGEGQYDVASNGTLVYAVGDNAEIGHIVHVRPPGVAKRLPLEPAAFLRYHPHPDGRRLAAVVQGARAQELRIYDMRDGSYSVWLRGWALSHPHWSPRGDRLAILARDGPGESGVLLIGSPESATPPDTVVAASFPPDPMSWQREDLLIARTTGGTAVALDPSRRPARVDTLLKEGNFPDLSPDGRLLTFMAGSGGPLLVTPYPSRDRLIHVATEAGEPRWVSSTRIRYRVGVTWHEADVSPSTLQVQRRPRLVHADAGFSDTPGLSHRTTVDGGMLYVQGAARTSATYLRVVPNWVAQMKRAVNQADR